MTASPAAGDLIGIGLMCKPPRPGDSKTRLARGIGPAAAAMLATAFLRDTAETILTVAPDAGLKPVALYRPADAAGEISGLLGPDWPVAHCDAADLGQAMLGGLAGLLASCPDGAIVIGADLPTLPAANIVRAAAALREGCSRTVVIGASTDGGYHLIGIRDAVLAAPLFAPMAWSTGGVYAETRRRAAAAGLIVVETGTWFDVDADGDLERLATDLAARPEAAPATRKAMAALGLLSSGASGEPGAIGGHARN